MDKNVLKIAVLASGRGSNFGAILEAIAENKISAKIKVLLCNHAKAGAIRIAKKNNIPVEILEHQKFSNRDTYTEALCVCLQKYSVDLIVLAGFMRVLGKKILNQYKDRIINIHPSLLPAFPGLNAIEKALQHGSKITGVTVHFVDDGVDTGAIIAQERVPIGEEDTLETLENRIHETEHMLYPKVLQWFAENRVEIHNHQVRIKK